MRARHGDVGAGGVATALAVAIVLTVYFRIRYRSPREVLRHGLAAALVLALVAFVPMTCGMRAGLSRHHPTSPAVEFEIRLPRAALSAIADTQVELHTDRNQILAQVQGARRRKGAIAACSGARCAGLPTRDRVVILNLPGQATCEFKLRLAANPSRSQQFSPGTSPTGSPRRPWARNPAASRTTHSPSATGALAHREGVRRSADRLASATVARRPSDPA